MVGVTFGVTFVILFQTKVKNVIKERANKSTKI